MPNFLKAISIRNFKSLKSVDMKPSRVNVFIGKPNSGKSNLLEALSLHQMDSMETDNLDESNLLRASSGTNLFYDSDTSELISIQSNAFRYYVSEFARSTHCHFFSWKKPIPATIWNKILAEYSNDHSPNLNKILRDSELGEVLNMTAVVVNREGKIDRSNMQSQFHIPIFKYDFPARINYYQDSFKTRLRPNASNLYEIVKTNGTIKRWLANIFLEYGLELIIDTVSRKFEIHKKQDGFSYKIPFENTPDTVRRMLYHMAAIHSNKDAVILFEEPEAHSFPPYIDELAANIAEDQSNQYFITTHSPYMMGRLMSNMTKASELAIFYTYWQDYQTKVKKLTQKEVDHIYNSGADIFFNIELLGKK
ncbi:MAG: AAA family ATPase [Flavobacteriales bacterium]|nr:AAA family ATPase [Flavobacteriales bacterium]